MVKIIYVQGKPNTAFVSDVDLVFKPKRRDKDEVVLGSLKNIPVMFNPALKGRNIIVNLKNIYFKTTKSVSNGFICLKAKLGDNEYNSVYLFNQETGDHITTLPKGSVVSMVSYWPSYAVE